MRRLARAKTVPVGKSGVTPCKHFIHNRLLGKIIGSTGTGHLPVSPDCLYLYDLTAGDGRPAIPEALDSTPLLPEALTFVDPIEAFEKHCSPGIYLKHVAKLDRNKLEHVPPIDLTLAENLPATFSSLAYQVEGYLKHMGWLCVVEEPSKRLWRLDSYPGDEVSILKTDARLLLPPACGREDIVHVYADPNHIHDWVLTPAFLNGCPPFTTSLTTLGCNVGGLKMMSKEERVKWYDKVEEVSRSLVRSWHDACLLSLGNASQWAYLITAPATWREETKQVCRNAVKQAKGINLENVRMAFLKEDPTEFRAIQDYLFLTKTELS